MTTPGQSLRKAADDLDATLASIANDDVDLQEQVSALAAGQEALRRDVDALKAGNPPTDPDNPTDPVDPPAPSGRRFGCNMGYKVDEEWSPDKPDDPRYVGVAKPVGKGIRVMDWWKTNDDLNVGGFLGDDDKALLDKQLDLAIELGVEAFYLCLLFHDSAETIVWKVSRCRERLGPNVTIYVEWINEPWNGGGYDNNGTWVITGTAVYRELLRVSGVDRWWDGSGRFFKTWAALASAAFASAKLADPTCVTVLGCLTGNVWVAQQVEKYLTVKPDAHGLTWYFGAGVGDNPPTTMTWQQIIESSKKKIEDKELPNISEHAAYSRSIGRRIVGYEGLSHYTLPVWQHESHRDVWKAMNEANRRPEIVPLCERVASHAESEGYEFLFIFMLTSIYDRHGSFGLLEGLDDTDNPKYRYAAGVDT